MWYTIVTKGKEVKEMYKTIWAIHDETTDSNIEFTYYHFGKEPKIATWYFEADHVYTVEMIWNIKLIKTPSLFFSCLFHDWIVR